MQKKISDNIVADFSYFNKDGIKTVVIFEIFNKQCWDS